MMKIFFGLQLGFNLVLISLAGQANAENTFTVINNSSRVVYAAKLFYTPQSSRSGDLAVFTYENWTAEGWWKVEPGTKSVIYNGSREKIYVRLTYDSGIRGTVIKPRRSEGETNFAVYSSRFTVRENVAEGPNRVFSSYTENGAWKNKSGRSIRDIDATVVDGFYLVKSHTDFTVD